MNTVRMGSGCKMAWFGRSSANWGFAYVGLTTMKAEAGDGKLFASMKRNEIRFGFWIRNGVDVCEYGEV